MCGEPLDLSHVDMPTYIYGSREDHIVPWDGAYRNTQVLPGRKRFMLGASGHIAGVINPPAKGKRSHWVGSASQYPASAEDWLENGGGTAGQLVARLGSLAQGPRRQASGRAPFTRQREAPPDRTRARALRQTEGLNGRHASFIHKELS